MFNTILRWLGIRKRKRPRIVTGYVYLLQCKQLGGYKIGITINPTSRFSALKVPQKAKRIGLWSTDERELLEQELHSRYKEERVPQSEWFALTDDQVLEVITVMNDSQCTTSIYVFPTE